MWRRPVRSPTIEWNVHDYCKAEVRHDCKMGHITVLTDDTAKTVADLEATGCAGRLEESLTS